MFSGNVRSPQELALVEKAKLQKIVDDPLLLNTIFPVLSKVNKVRQLIILAYRVFKKFWAHFDVEYLGN